MLMIINELMTSVACSHRPDKVLRSFTDSLLPRVSRDPLKDHACLATDTTKQWRVRAIKTSTVAKLELCTGIPTRGAMNSRTLCSVVFGIAVAACSCCRSHKGARRTSKPSTFDHSVEVPGCVLQAGSWFVRDTRRVDVVRIFSLDWKGGYATEMTASAERRRRLTIQASFAGEGVEFGKRL